MLATRTKWAQSLRLLGDVEKSATLFEIRAKITLLLKPATQKTSKQIEFSAFLLMPLRIGHTYEGDVAAVSKTTIKDRETVSDVMRYNGKITS